MPHYESSSEAEASRRLRAILSIKAQGESLITSEGFGDFLDPLAGFLMQVLADVYVEWKYIGIDGDSSPGDIENFGLIKRAVKLGANEAELCGECYLWHNYPGELPPALIYVRLRIADAVDAIEALDCRLGEYPKGGTANISRIKALKLASPRDWVGRPDFPDVDSLDWIYEVVVGEDFA